MNSFSTKDCNDESGDFRSLMKKCMEKQCGYLINALVIWFPDKKITVLR